MNEIVTERPHLFEPNVYIAVCVEMAGKVCPQKLSVAVKQAFDAEAVAGIGKQPENPDNPDTPDNPNNPDTPDNPDTPNNSDTPDNPNTSNNPINLDILEKENSLKTGDTDMTRFYIIFSFVAGVTELGMIFGKRKKDRTEV